MFSALCLTLSAAIWFYILKYRVHFHATYTPTKTRKARATGPKSANTDNGILRPVRPEESRTIPPIRRQTAISNEPLRGGGNQGRPDARRRNPPAPGAQNLTDVGAADNAETTISTQTGKDRGRNDRGRLNRISPRSSLSGQPQRHAGSNQRDSEALHSEAAEKALEQSTNCKDVESALRNLGCRPAIARGAAARATKEANDFQTALKLAIQYATTEAA